MVRTLLPQLLFMSWFVVWNIRESGWTLSTVTVSFTVAISLMDGFKVMQAKLFTLWRLSKALLNLVSVLLNMCKLIHVIRVWSCCIWRNDKCVCISERENPNSQKGKPLFWNSTHLTNEIWWPALLKLRTLSCISDLVTNTYQLVHKINW